MSYQGEFTDGANVVTEEDDVDGLSDEEYREYMEEINQRFLASISSE